MLPELDYALLNLSRCLGGGYAEGEFSDVEVVWEAIRRLEQGQTDALSTGSTQ